VSFAEPRDASVIGNQRTVAFDCRGNQQAIGRVAMLERVQVDRRALQPYG
jgi:hypothetical protein